MSVRPKKHLGQHFLNDRNICRKIARQYSSSSTCNTVLEIGPGMGALTRELIDEGLNVYVIEIDSESVAYLETHFPELQNKIFQADFLLSDLTTFFGQEPFGIVGNFPYNISSQILFKCLDYRDQIPEIMGMFQKEVAQRIAEKPGSKGYGILSVLMQTYYDISYCFTVDEHVFIPPPKVKSGVIRCTRNERKTLPCDEKLFIRIVKACFNQRRKTIRNSIKLVCQIGEKDHPLLSKRPEQLSVEEFIELCHFTESCMNS